MSERTTQPRIHIIDVGPGHMGLASLIASQVKDGNKLVMDIEAIDLKGGLPLNPFDFAPLQMTPVDAQEPRDPQARFGS